MDIRKIIMYLVVSLLGVMIWTTWQKDFPPPAVQSAKSATQTEAGAGKPQSFTPSAFTPSTDTNTLTVHPGRGSKPVTAPAQFKHDNTSQKSDTISVKTDVLHVQINPRGGDLVTANLLQYPVSTKTPHEHIQILSTNPEMLSLAQSGVTNHINSSTLRFSSPKHQYVMTGKTLSVTLHSHTKAGLKISKTYTFHKGKYFVDTVLSIQNKGKVTWTGNAYFQLTKKNRVKKHHYFSRSFSGAAISSSNKPYEKISFEDLSDKNLSKNIQQGWLAFQQPYFLSAWVPKGAGTYHYYSHSFGQGEKGIGNTYVLGCVTPSLQLHPGKKVELNSSLYIGPELSKQLNSVAPGLDRTIDYGWLWFLSKPIFTAMSAIHSVVGNWGWSIVLVTLLIKLIFFPLSHKSFVSMARMRELAPRLQSIKDRHSDDRQALAKATMELYKKEKVNPAGSCLPMLIQIPFFIALYYVLIESVQLREAPFMLWIHDLAGKDPYYVLPVLMGLSMLLQQKLSPTPPDPTQAKVMMLLPVVFTVFFLSFPAGLVLYWLTNNCLTILQQWLVMKNYDAKSKKKKRNKR